MEWTREKIEKIYKELRKKRQLIHNGPLPGWEGSFSSRRGSPPAVDHLKGAESEAAWSEFLESLGIKKRIILWDEDSDKLFMVGTPGAPDEACVTIFSTPNCSSRYQSTPQKESSS